MEEDPPPLRFGGFLLDRAARRLLGADGAEVVLTAMEFDLLLALAERPKPGASPRIKNTRDWRMAGARIRVTAASISVSPGCGASSGTTRPIHG